jgi:hypothetical protein
MFTIDANKLLVPTPSVRNIKNEVIVGRNEENITGIQYVRQVQICIASNLAIFKKRGLFKKSLGSFSVLFKSNLAYFSTLKVAFKSIIPIVGQFSLFLYFSKTSFPITVMLNAILTAFVSSMVR